MTDLEDIPEELRPATRSDVADTIVATLLGTLLLLVYVAAAPRWPGGPVAWVGVGAAIYVAAVVRVYGPPWRSA